METPLIFDITKASFDDGPGVRTVVFLKGCPLRCVWCHNPESQNKNQEIFFSPEKCISCGNCELGKECFTLARQIVGKTYEPRELIEIILEDKSYYLCSSGGVTFSGGEPSSFMDYLREVFLLLKKENIHITFQTCGFFNYDEFAAKLLPFIDLIHFDIKLMEEKKHIKYTGVSNKKILKNFKYLVNAKINLLPRITLVPGITATKENLTIAADLFAQNRINTCEFLTYNPSGIDKLIRLGKSVSREIPSAPLSTEEETLWIEFFHKTLADKAELREIVSSSFSSFGTDLNKTRDF